MKTPLQYDDGRSVESVPIIAIPLWILVFILTLLVLAVAAVPQIVLWLFGYRGFYYTEPGTTEINAFPHFKGALTRS